MRAIIHIGLPRSASASLQTSYFPAVAAEYPAIVYAGAHRPRRDEETTIYRAFRESIGGEAGRGQLTRVLAKLACDTVIFSDTSIAREIPGRPSSWRMKVERLAKELAPFDHRIVVTVRDPLDAARSYFPDIYYALPRGRRSLIQQVESPPLEVFRHARLFACLHEHFGPERIAVVDYGDVAAGHLQALDEALEISPTGWALPHLGRRHRLDGLVRTERLSLEQAVVHAAPAAAKDLVCRMAAGLPDRLRRVRTGPRLHVPDPTNIDLGGLAQFYAPDVTYLRERFGIEPRRTSSLRLHPSAPAPRGAQGDPDGPIGAAGTLSLRAALTGA